MKNPESWVNDSSVTATTLKPTNALMGKSMPCHIIGVSQPAIRGDTPKVTTKNEMKGQALSPLRNTVNINPTPVPVMAARPTEFAKLPLVT